jgi:hypothetical protein
MRYGLLGRTTAQLLFVHPLVLKMELQRELDDPRIERA